MKKAAKKIMNNIWAKRVVIALAVAIVNVVVEAIIYPIADYKGWINLALTSPIALFFFISMTEIALASVASVFKEFDNKETLPTDN